MVQWRFPSNDNSEIRGINDSGISMFRGTPLKSLAREICQNSLDAGVEKTVTIEFDMFTIPTQELPGADYLKDVFERCLDFWGSQTATTTKDFFKNALKAINKEECNILRISDFNTKGLTGVKEEINTDWVNLIKSSGVSDKKGTAGGSYGIGKYAPFACSDFATVFYSTHNQDNESAFQGVSRLVTFRNENDDTTQGIGYFGNEKNTPVLEQIDIEHGFHREKGNYGTDIYITGYKYGNNTWEKDIIIAILDGFLGAIWNETLIVKVNNTYISKNMLLNLIDLYRDELTGYTDKYYQVLASEDTVWEEKNFMGLGNIRLGVLLGDPEAPKRIAMIRSTGMKIKDQDRLPSLIPFVGIIFIEGEEINKRLRAIENPEHTAWQPERAKNPASERALLAAITKYIKDRINELASTGNSEEIDAVGVGVYLPDEADDSNNQSKNETISDNVIEIEKSKPRKKAMTNSDTGKFVGNGELVETGGMEEDGDGEGYFHTGGQTHHKQQKKGQSAHPESGHSKNKPTIKDVSIKKFVPVCVDKNKGQYVLMLVPDNDTKNGTIEVYLSGETQSYEAPLLSASVIGKENVEISGNQIKGIDLKKDEPIRIKIQMDYKDYCAMEVKLYAVEE